MRPTLSFAGTAATAAAAASALREARMSNAIFPMKKTYDSAAATPIPRATFGLRVGIDERAGLGRVRAIGTPARGTSRWVGERAADARAIAAAEAVATAIGVAGGRDGDAVRGTIGADARGGVGACGVGADGGAMRS